ncbi:hypothetical protein ACFL3P_02045 [Pseudomonadota bacterium]
MVLMVVMLPLRSVFAMPLDMSSDHCKTEAVAAEMNMMNHAGHHMPSDESIETEQEQNKSACVCCSQCDGGCAGCVHISAVTFEFHQFSDVRTNEPVLAIADSLLTRIISPPSRPPLIL